MSEIIYLLDGVVVAVLAAVLLSGCFAGRRHDQFLQSLRANVPTVNLDFDTAQKAAGEFDPTVVRESRESARDGR